MCHGFRLLKRDDCIWVTLDHFWSKCNFLRQMGLQQKLARALIQTTIFKFNHVKLDQIPDLLRRFQISYLPIRSSSDFPPASSSVSSVSSPSENLNENSVRFNKKGWTLECVFRRFDLFQSQRNHKKFVRSFSRQFLKVLKDEWINANVVQRREIDEQKGLK